MRHSLRAVSLWWLIVLVPITGAADRNKAPKAKNDDAITAVDTSVPIPVMANDRDRDGRSVRKRNQRKGWKVRIVLRPGQGTVANQRDGTVIYTPGPNFSGPDKFKYRVKDNRGAWSNEAKVRVTVGTPEITSLEDDNGPSKSDFITNDTTPTLIGRVPTGLIEVTLHDGITVSPAVPVIDGAWSYTSGELPNGVYTFTATGENAVGKKSSPSAAKIVTIKKNNGPTSPSINPRDGCNVNESELPGFVPPEEPPDDPESLKCLELGGPDEDPVFPVRLELREVDRDENFDEHFCPDAPIHTRRVRDGFSDGILRIDMNDEDPLTNLDDTLPAGTYQMKFFVSDLAGNESCVESEKINPLDLLCSENSSQTFLEIFDEPPFRAACESASAP